MKPNKSESWLGGELIMRPEEIDYSDTRKHYFDLLNGEVLAGRQDRARYIRETGAEAVRVVELGPLLRDPTPHLDPYEADYDRLDTSDWSREKLVDFARWLGRVVPAPENYREERLTKKVMWHARVLGIGPGVHAVRKEFGTHTNLYAEARIADARKVGLYDDWDVDDAVAYVRRIGGDRRPTVEDLKKRNKTNPNNPLAGWLTDRFSQIGGFYKILELAGYTIIQNWDDEDYIDWGVRVMRANDGEVPSQTMIDYLSKQDRGPSASIVARRFDYLRNFQREVVTRFYNHQAEAEQQDKEQLARIDADMRDGVIPLELFSPLSHDSDASDEQRQELQEELERLYPDKNIDLIVEALGAKETIIRYAKFKVIEEVASQLETDTKITIARGLSDRNFVSAITKTAPMPPGDIEYAALVEGFFDYIWPDDDRLESLKMDEGYRQQLDHRKELERKRRSAKKAAAAAIAA